MKKIVTILLLIWSTYGFSQALNGYKFLIVPAKFDFQKTENQYQINYLMEAYFKQQGFTVVYDKDITKEMKSNLCNAIFCTATKESNMFITKITVTLKDCEGKLLLAPSIGNSRSKEYDVSYREAMRMALMGFPNQNYVFDKVAARKTIISKNSAVENLTESTEIKTMVTKEQNVLIAETLANGFLLIDAATSKVYLKMFQTNAKDVFIGVSNTKNGVVTRSNSKFTFEYVMDNKVTTEILNVKF